MAVTNGWGRAIDNSIGYGQAAVYATNGYGTIELVSWSGDTIIDAPPFADDQWQAIGEQWQAIDKTWNLGFPNTFWNEETTEYELINTNWN
jgi:hypothetical protein